MTEQTNPNYTITPSEVHVYYISLQLPEAEKSGLLLNLSSEEEAELNNCVNPAERTFRRFLRGSLREILGKYSNTAPEVLQFTENSHGKPALHPVFTPSPIHFNLSHSGTLAVIAVSGKGTVGIDIEQVKPRKHFRDIALRFFTPPEQEYLFADKGEKEVIRRFYYLWTRKEAVVKAMGESLPPWLQKLTVLPGNPGETWTKAGTSLLPAGNLICLETPEGYAGALCAEGQPEILVFK